MKGLIKGGPEQAAPNPGQEASGPEQAAPNPEQGGPDKVMAMLVLQPLKMLYSEKGVQTLNKGASEGDPAKVLAAAAISAVSGSAKAGMSKGVEITPDQIGAAVIEVIKSLSALLIAGGTVPPDQVEPTIQQAIQLAAQGGEPQGEEVGPPPTQPPAPPMQPGAM